MDTCFLPQEWIHASYLEQLHPESQLGKAPLYMGTLYIVTFLCSVVAAWRVFNCKLYVAATAFSALEFSFLVLWSTGWECLNIFKYNLPMGS